MGFEETRGPFVEGSDELILLACVTVRFARVILESSCRSALMILDRCKWRVAHASNGSKVRRTQNREKGSLVRVSKVKRNKVRQQYSPTISLSM